jgi:hypothetical protein
MPCGKINVLKVDGWKGVEKCVHVFWMVNLFLYVTFSLQKPKPFLASLTTIHVLGISNIINNAKQKARSEREKSDAKETREKRSFLILLTVTRTRTNYYNFCRFNIFNIHCDTFFSWPYILCVPRSSQKLGARNAENVEKREKKIPPLLAVNCDNSVFSE